MRSAGITAQLCSEDGGSGREGMHGKSEEKCRRETIKKNAAKEWVHIVKKYTL